MTPLALKKLMFLNKVEFGKIWEFATDLNWNLDFKEKLFLAAVTPGVSHLSIC
jgi:hypothetical protein